MKARKQLVVPVTMLLVLVMTTVLFISACAAPTPEPTPAPAAPQQLKIGCAIPISGPTAAVGLAWARGYELAADWINDQGGIKVGNDVYLIDLIIEDDGFNPEKAATANTKLVYDDKVKFVIAFVDFMIIPGYEITAANGVLQVVSFIVEVGGPADVGPDKPLRFRANVTGTGLQPFNYEYLVKNYPDVEDIVIAVYEDTIHEADIELSKSLAAKHGLNVVGVERFPFTTADWLPVWTRILAHNPDAVDRGVSNPGHLGFELPVARGLGFEGPIMKVSPGDPNVILSIAGPEAGTGLFGVGIDASSPKMPPLVGEIVTRWAAKYAEPFSSDAIMAWDAVWTLAQGIEKAQSIDPEVVLQTLETMTEPGSLQTLEGPAHMGGLQTYGVNRVVVKPIPYCRLENGKVEFIDFYMPDVP